MKFNLHSTHGNSRLGGILLESGLAWLVALLAFIALPLRAAEVTNTLEIQSIFVNGKPLPLRGKESVNLGSHPENVAFSFSAGTNGCRLPLRLRYTLEGYENVWHEQRSAMTLTVRFYNESGDMISPQLYPINGESPGWTGSLKSSQMTHRRETIVVPPQATRLMVVISSAGPPDAVGIYVVANLVV